MHQNVTHYVDLYETYFRRKKKKKKVNKMWTKVEELVGHCSDQGLSVHPAQIRDIRMINSCR